MSFDDLMGVKLYLGYGLSVLADGHIALLSGDSRDDVVVDAVLKVFFNSYRNIELNKMNRTLRVDNYDLTEDEWERLIGRVSSELAKSYKAPEETVRYIDRTLVDLRYIVDPDVFSEYSTGVIAK